MLPDALPRLVRNQIGFSADAMHLAVDKLAFVLHSLLRLRVDAVALALAL